MNNKKENNTIAYVYKWTHIPSLKWYVGSRTAKGCHPDDGYLCSSKIVKPLIQSNPHEWSRVVLETGDPKEMLELETEILVMFDARNDPRSFNLHNGYGEFTMLNVTGENHPMFGRKHTEATIAKIRAKLVGRRVGNAAKPKKGRKLSEESKAKISVANKGKVPSPEARAKISAALKNRKVTRNKPKTKTIVATNLTTGEQFELNGVDEIKAAGFRPCGVSKCANGKQPYHKGHMFCFKYDDNKLRGERGKSLSPEVRAEMSASRIKTIIATNLSTGFTFEINGHKEMKALGFDSSAISKCARGLITQYKGHTFKFKIDNEPTEKDVASHQPAD